MNRIRSTIDTDRRRASLRWLVLLAGYVALSACGGGGGNDGVQEAASLEVAVPVGTVGNSVISGKATYARVPHDPLTNGLMYAFTYDAPIRGALIELVADDGTTLQTAMTSDQGDYRFTAPVGQRVSVRVKAQLRQDLHPAWDIRVVDNTSQDALYTLTTGRFITSGAEMTRDLSAPSGWDGSGYSNERAAAPFAILDTVYTAVQHVVQTGMSYDFPPLSLYWSPKNRPTVGSLADGEIGSSLFRPFAGGREIYILGAANADTDEYDEHVIAHEFTHYLHFHFGRSDSPGGSHSMADRLDPRVAFSEGLASGFASMFLDDPVYIDSLGFEQSGGMSVNLENNAVRNAGWFSQVSVQSILYDLYDSNPDGVDQIELGFAPVFESLTGSLRSGVALVTIHAYLDALKRQQPALRSTLVALANEQDIHTLGSDAYGAGETNSAARFDKVLPIYTDLPLDGRSVQVCTIAGAQGFGTRNKLGNRRFLKFDITSAMPNVTTVITAQGPPDSDPELVLHQVGRVQSSLNDTAGTERLRRIFTEGSYVLEVYEYANMTDQPMGSVCFDLSVGVE